MLAVVGQELGSPLPYSLLWSYISCSTLKAFFSWSFLKYWPKKILALVLLFSCQKFLGLFLWFWVQYNYLKSFFLGGGGGGIRKNFHKYKNVQKICICQILSPECQPRLVSEMKHYVFVNHMYHNHLGIQDKSHVTFSRDIKKQLFIMLTFHCSDHC